ncbi:MAG: hypothetical protein JWN72_1134 [Thermoleophilia bacterium]|nr:hypothetical protein [Thermoleophilia bacterium]
MTRNATCINCGTRIDMDVIRFCPYCEAERERVRGYRPQVKVGGSGGGAALRAIGWFVGVLVVVGVALVIVGAIRS